MQEKVYISGIGAVSAIGNNVSEIALSLLEGKVGMGRSSFINTCYKDEIPVAEVKCSNAELSEMLSLPADNRLTRASLMGIMAVKEALSDAGISDCSGRRTGLISSTSVGGMDKTEVFFTDYLLSPQKGRLRNVIGHDCADNTLQIADYFHIDGFTSTISTACSSSANAIMLGARLIKSGMLDRVICGGVDSLTKFTINGFNTLMILDREHCRPFDDTRSGLNIGEAAAYVVMESEKSMLASNKFAYCALSGYGNACDAFHQTASSPEGTGAALAMRKALEVAGLSVSDISYINVHGTGTPNNDLSEGVAMEQVFGRDTVPPFSSTKAFTGHTLGAAGAIEAVICLLSLKNQLIYPNLNFTTRIKELNISPIAELRKDIELKHILSNSFGFGGNNTSLIFSKC